MEKGTTLNQGCESENNKNIKVGPAEKKSLNNKLDMEGELGE